MRFDNIFDSTLYVYNKDMGIRSIVFEKMDKNISADVSFKDRSNKNYLFDLNKKYQDDMLSTLQKVYKYFYGK